MPGRQHEAIIDAELWAAVKDKLLVGAVREAGPQVTPESALLGKLFDADGNSLTTSHALKNGRRYRYYVSRPGQFGSDQSAHSDSDHAGDSGWRLPSDEIEQRVRHLVGVMLADRAAVIDAAQRADYPALRLPHLIAGLDSLASDWAATVRRVELRRSEIRITLAISGEPEVLMEHRFPMQLRRRGVEMRLVVASKAPEVRRDPELVKRLGQAFRWWQLISTGQVDTIAAIARTEGLDRIYVGRVLPLALLAPDIVEAIVKGDQPTGLTAVKIMRGHGDVLPLVWSKQRSFLGFESRISR